MSDHDLKPLGDDIEALLRQGRALDEPPSAVKARVLTHVERALLHGGGGGGGGAASPPRPRGIATALASRRALAAVTFVLGGVTGAVGYATLSPSAPARVVYLDRVVVSGQTSTVVPPVPSPAAPVPAPRAASSTPVAIAAAPPSPRAARPLAEATPSSGQLDKERAVLDIARTALGRGDGAAALIAIDEHASKFERGILAEEREALAVQALIRAGRPADARARGKRFERRFPESLMLPAVQASMATIP